METVYNLTSSPNMKIFSLTPYVENNLPFLLNELVENYHIDDLGDKKYIVIDEALKHIIFLNSIEEFTYCN